MHYNVAIIGGGPGGYTAAAHAAAGGSVVLFERSALGGTCLNRGCIPTKALLHASELYGSISRAEVVGVRAKGVSYDFAAMHRRKNQVVETLRQGVEKQMKAGKISVVQGSAKLLGGGRIACGGEEWTADDIIIAAGSVPAIPPIVGAEKCCTSDDLLEGEGKDFSSLVIIGGGVIGVECASIYLPLGCRVTILEMAPQLLPSMDREIAQRLAMSLKKQGVAVETQAAVQSVTETDGALTVSYLDKKGAEHSVTAEGVLMATGRRACIDGLFAEGAEPKLERGAVAADAEGRTSVPHLYVIGDARAGNVQLAHVAAAQGENVAALLSGREKPVDETLVPSCVYTSPEIASVGLSEEAAKAAGIAVKTGKCLTGTNGKCLIEDAAAGYVKLVAESESGRLLGAQLVCPRATDMIAELALAVQRGVTAAQLAAVIHLHPTFSEMICAAASALAE